MVILLLELHFECRAFTSNRVFLHFNIYLSTRSEYFFHLCFLIKSQIPSKLKVSSHSPVPEEEGCEKENRDGLQPLRNWNSLFCPLIELQYVGSLHCISHLCVCLTLFQLHIKKAICSKKKRVQPTHHAPISSTSFLRPASRHATAHRLINFPLWFNHRVKVALQSFTTETIFKKETESYDS